MRGVFVDECLAVLNAVCDVIFYIEEDCLTFPAIIWLNLAIFVLDQFEELPSYCLFIEIRTFLERMSF
jgi:hypothetical protein